MSFAVWSTGRIRVTWRVEVLSGSTWTDVTPGVMGIDIQEDIDMPGPRAILLMDRENWHPDTSPLKLGAWVRIWGGYSDLSGGPVYEYALLYGRVGGMDLSSPQMTVDVYDASEALLSRWIETEKQYTASQTLRVRIQDVLNSYASDLNITVLEPVTLNITLPPQRLSVQPVWRAIEDMAALVGAKLRWRYTTNTGWRLTLYSPPRTKTTPDHVLDDTLWLSIRRLRQTLESVRNVVEVVYGDVGNRFIHTAQDSASISKYGRRWCRINEASDFPITNHSAAQRLATAILTDLREPVAEVEVELIWAPFISIHDLVRLNPDGHALRSAATVAVSGVRHTLRRGQARTYITGRSQNPPGYYEYWLRREVGRAADAPGVPPNVNRTPAPNPYTPSSPTVAATARGLHVIIPPEYDPSYLATELQISTSSTFIGAQSYVMTGFSTVLTSWPNGTALTPGTTYYLRYRYLYQDGRASPWSYSASGVMPQLGSGDIANRAIKPVHLDAVWTPDLPGTFTPPSPGSGAALWGRGLDVYQSSTLKLRVGDISGLSFRGATLPSGTYGLWAPDGYIAVGGGQDAYTAQSSQYTIPGNTFGDVSGMSVSFTLNVPSVVLLWYHAEAEGTVNISAAGTNGEAGVYVEARLTTSNTGGGVLNNLSTDSIRRIGDYKIIYSSTRFQINPRGTLAWMRLYTLPAGSYTIQLQARRSILAGSGNTVSGNGYLYGRGVGALIVR